MNGRLVAALSLAAVAACDASPTEAPGADDLLARLGAEGCPVPDRLAPASWARFEASAFSFSVPDGYRRVFTQPVGSEAVVFIRDGEFIAYDLAWPPPGTAGVSGPDGASGSDEARSMRSSRAWAATFPTAGWNRVIASCETTLAGRAVALSLTRDGDQLAVRAEWPAFREGVADGHLRIEGRANDRAAANDQLSAILSVRPEPPPE